MIRRIVIVIALVSPQAGHVVEFVVGIVTHGSTFRKRSDEQIAAQYNGSHAALQCRARPGQNAPTKGTTPAIDPLQPAQHLRM
jgi:hypothetical protein